MKQHRPTPDPADDREGAAAAGQSPLLVRLVAQVDHLAHELDAALPALAGLRVDVDTHTRTLADLTDLLRRLTPDSTLPGHDTSPPAPTGDTEREADFGAVEWLTITDPAVAVAALPALWVWTRDVFAPYIPAAAEGLPGCWPWHPTVVAELLACQAAWASAIHPDAPLEALAGWHDRWRPGTWTRIAPTVKRCARDVDGLHVDANARYAHDPAWLDEYATWWTTTHQHHAGPDTPGLTVHNHQQPRPAAAAGTNVAHR